MTPDIPKTGDPEPEQHSDGSDVDAVERGEKPAGSMESEVDRAQKREEEAAEG